MVQELCKFNMYMHFPCGYVNVDTGEDEPGLGVMGNVDLCVQVF